LRLALALALYAFLALILLYLWRDVRASATAAGAIPQAYLELAGPRCRKAFPLLPVNLLGRAADNTIVLDETTVSAHHARLSYQRPVVAGDQGSKNAGGVNELDLQEPLVVTPEIASASSVVLVLHGGPVPWRLSPQEPRRCSLPRWLTCAWQSSGLRPVQHGWSAGPGAA
jgi:hypothetical protein